MNQRIAVKIRSIFFRYASLTIFAGSFFFICELNVLAEDSGQKMTYDDFPKEDRRILENGEISPIRHTVGSVLSIYPGAGIGHAVEGRFGSRGWIFMTGEVATAWVIMPLLIAGPAQDSKTDRIQEAVLTVAISAYLGFKIWEIVDAIGGPFWDNERYRLLHSRYKIADGHNLRILPVPLIRQVDGGRTTSSIGLGLQWSMN